MDGGAQAMEVGGVLLSILMVRGLYGNWVEPAPKGKNMSVLRDLCWLGLWQLAENPFQRTPTCWKRLAGIQCYSTTSELSANTSERSPFLTCWWRPVFPGPHWSLSVVVPFWMYRWDRRRSFSSQISLPRNWRLWLPTVRLANELLLADCPTWQQKGHISPTTF